MNLKVALINETEFDYDFIKSSLPNDDIELNWFEKVQSDVNYYDVYIIDKKHNAPNIVKHIKNNAPKASIYVISDYDNTSTLKTLLKIGVDGFLDKENITNEEVCSFLKKEYDRKCKLLKITNKLKVALSK